MFGALAALVLLLVLSTGAARRPPSPPTAAPARAGRVAGTVTLSTTLAKRRPSFRIYADAGPGSSPPPSRVDPAAELRNVVIYIEAAPSSPGVVLAGTRGKLSMAQAGERFVPHVLPVLQGTTVEFPNQDDVFHNVFSLSSAGRFDLGRYPKGSSKDYEFTKPGTVQVFCHIHSDMSAVVLVLANPFYATPDQSGHFAIEDLPDGVYTIVAWHERIKPITRRITVVAGQTTPLDFNIPIPEPSP